MLAGPRAIFDGAGGDFAAFYCGGNAVLQHRNPYLVEPLRSCESRVQPSAGRTSGVVDPSPLPGYALSLFGTLARLPYGVAKAMWFTALLLSLVVAAFSISRLSGLSTVAVLVFLIPVDGILNFVYGQLPPIVVAAMAFAAYLLERRKYVLAAVIASITMLEPNLGLPACLALFLWLPRTRVALGVLGAFYAIIAVSTLGVAGNVAYFRTYLPAQARAELVATDQLSLSALLHLAGLPDRLALLAGTVSYVVMLCVGIFLAQRAARALGSDAFIILLPPAAVLLGGSYVHDIQFAAALPAALLLFSKTSPSRFVPWLVASLLMFPWFSFSSGGHSIGIVTRLIGAVAVSWLAAIALSTRPIVARAAGVAGAAFAFVVLLAFFSRMPAPEPQAAIALPSFATVANANASANWGAYLRATPALSTPSVRRQLEKLPLWIGIALMLVVIVGLGEKAPMSAPSGSSTRRSRGPKSLASGA